MEQFLFNTLFTLPSGQLVRFTHLFSFPAILNSKVSFSRGLKEALLNNPSRWLITIPSYTSMEGKGIMIFGTVCKYLVLYVFTLSCKHFVQKCNKMPVICPITHFPADYATTAQSSLILYCVSDVKLHLPVDRLWVFIAGSVQPDSCLCVCGTTVNSFPFHLGKF